MHIVLKHQVKSTQFLLSRALSTLVNPISFLDSNFSSLNNVSKVDNHEEHSSKSIDLPLVVQLQQRYHGSVCNSYVLNKLISSCATSRSLYLGIQVHSFVFRMGIGSNLYINTAVVDMYGKCGVISAAQKVFDEMPHRNVITWNTLMSRYLHAQYMDVLINLFVGMLMLGISPTHYTVSTVLVGCSELEALELGEQMHCLCTKSGFLSNVVVGTALLDMYWKCSNVDDSCRIFDDLPNKNAVTWTSMITGYTQNQQTNNAMRMIRKMMGRQVYALIIKSAHDSSMHIQNVLISMYARCGKINKAECIFPSMADHDTISWNSLLSGYAQHGYAKEAVEAFDQMTETKVKVKPDLTTFLILISACSHVGWLDRARILELMKNDSSLEPLNAEHYACIVDLYARAGYLNEAEEFINIMPIEGGPEVYRALLSGCRVHDNKEIGVRSARKFVGRFPYDPAAYVQLSYILATDCYWAAGVPHVW